MNKKRCNHLHEDEILRLCLGELSQAQEDLVNQHINFCLDCQMSFIDIYDSQIFELHTSIIKDSILLSHYKC